MWRRQRDAVHDATRSARRSSAARTAPAAPPRSMPRSAMAAPMRRSGVCTPNHDGAITLGELPLIAGRRWRRSASRPTRRSIPRAPPPAPACGTGISAVRSATTPTGRSRCSRRTGTWWASTFPTATYAAPLSASSDLLGVFHVDAAAVTLLGVVSPDGGQLPHRAHLRPTRDDPRAAAAGGQHVERRRARSRAPPRARSSRTPSATRRGRPGRHDDRRRTASFRWCASRPISRGPRASRRC